MVGNKESTVWQKVIQLEKLVELKKKEKYLLNKKRKENI